MRVRIRAGGRFAFLMILIALVLGGCAGALTAAFPSYPPSATSSTAGGPVAEVPDEGQYDPATTTTVAPPEVVRIGALLPLTGDLAKQGAESLEGMRLAAEEINATGGIHSLGGARIELVQADSRGDPEVGTGEFNRLVAEQTVSAVAGAYQSSVALAVSLSAEELSVPFVVTTGAADEITEQGLEYTFRLCPKAEWYARDQVQFLTEGGLREEPITKVALLHEKGEFGTETAADQRKYLAEAGIEVVDEIAYPADQPNFHREIMQIKSGQAQALLTATYPDDAVLIADSAAKLHLDIPLLDAGGGTTDAGFLSRAGATSDLIITELEYCPGTSARQFEKDYAEVNGGIASAGALYSYQAVWLIANALERAASTEPERLRTALATTSMTRADHMVLPQRPLSFDQQGQNRGARLFQAQIQNLRYVPVWPAEYAQSAADLP